MDGERRALEKQAELSHRDLFGAGYLNKLEEPAQSPAFETPADEVDTDRIANECPQLSVDLLCAVLAYAQ